MNKEKRMFKTFEERQREMHIATFYSIGYWCNRKTSRYKYVNRRRIPKLWYMLRYIEFI